MRRTAALIVCVALWLGLAVDFVHAATGTAAPFVKPQYFDANGDPCNGCKLFIYTGGTSTKTTTYSDATLLSANTNPVVLDSAGRASVFLVPGTSVKLVLAPSNDSDPPLSAYWSVDGVQAVPPTSSSTDLDTTATAGENVAAGDAVYWSAGDGGTTAGRVYRTDADNTYSSSTAQAIGFATSAITTGSSGTIRRGGRITGLSGLTAGTSYMASATAGALTAVAPTNVRVLLIADSTTTGIILTGEPLASSTVPGIAGLIAQQLGTGTKTVDGLTSNAAITYKPGSAASAIATGSGVLGASVDTTQHANSGTGLTDLSTYILPASVLANTNTVLQCHAWGTYAANANTKAITFTFGGTSSIVQNSSVNGGGWRVDAMIIRTGAATQKMYAQGITRNGAGDYIGLSTAPGETLSGAITIKTKAQSETASSDILQEAFFCELSGG